MVPRLWLVTESEASRLVTGEPFATALRGLPPDDRMAVARLAVEEWRRQRAAGLRKRTLAKALAGAVSTYRRWRVERPDDYQLWRDVLKGGATHTTTTGSVGACDPHEPDEDCSDGCCC